MTPTFRSIRDTLRGRISQIRGAIGGPRTGTRRDDEATHIGSLVRDTWTVLEGRLQSKLLDHGVPTNFAGLDTVTQGLQPGELIFLVGRPSVGTTALGLNIVRNAALLTTTPVGVFSLDMSKRSMVERLICSEAAVDSYLLSTGQASVADFQRIARAMDRLNEAPLWIDDATALTINSLRVRARRMKARHGVKLILVDNLQLMRSVHHQSPAYGFTEVAAGLKSLAKELNVPVLVLAQLPAVPDGEPNGPPQPHDLLPLGRVDQHADVVLFLHRPGLYVDDGDPSVAQLHVAKNRSGPTTVIDLTFNPQVGTFAEVAREKAEV